MPCRIARTAEWSTRIIHEMEGKTGCFITLTYDDKHLPEDNSVTKDELQRFIKRLRKKIYPENFKYFGCGEYGEISERPHYHLILIGWNQETKDLIQLPNKKYYSPLIQSVWDKGNNQFGAASIEAIHYVTGYIRKKIYNKDNGANPFNKNLMLDGRFRSFQIQSIGLGKNFRDQNEDYIKKRGITFNGKRRGIP